MVKSYACPPVRFLLLIFFLIFPFTSNAQTNNCFLIHFSFHQVVAMSARCSMEASAGVSVRCSACPRHWKTRREFSLWSEMDPSRWLVRKCQVWSNSVSFSSFLLPFLNILTLILFLLLGCNPIIVLINNDGYTIEVEIHDGKFIFLFFSFFLSF